MSVHRGALPVAHVGLMVAVALLVAGLLSLSVPKSSLSRLASEDVRVRAALLASEPRLARLDAAEAAPLARELAARGAGDVTLYSMDGHELASTRAASKDESAVRERPEFKAALNGTPASVPTDRRAIRAFAAFGAPPRGVLELAVPGDFLESTAARLRFAVLGAVLGAFGLAASAAWIAAMRTRSAVDAMTAAVRRCAEGDDAVRIRGERRAGLPELVQAIEQLAARRSEVRRDLAAQRDLTGGILATMQEGVLVLDDQGRIEHVNPALREMMLWADDPRGRLPLEAIRNAQLQAILEQARTTGATASTEIEIAGLKPRRLLVRASPLRGGVGGTLAVVVDVTDLRRLETLRRDFVANVSHELRTPVAAVRSAAETLIAGARNDPEAADRFLAMIERNAERMQNLVDDLLDLTRIESRQLRLQPETLDLNAAVDQVLGLFRDRAEKKGLSLRASVPEGLRARADARAFEQVLSNLVDNAIKYCPAGAEVTIRAEGGTELRVAVEDTGPGIEARHHARLFERFYRVDPGRSREMGGTGLGLSIVKHLVESMGGSVGITSEPGRGSVFTFTVPAA